MKTIIIVFLIIFVFHIQTQSKYLPNKKYGEGFWPIDLGIAQSLNGDKVMNYYDFNHDKKTDIISIQNIDGNDFIVFYAWVDQKNSFSKVAVSEKGYQSILSILSTDLQMDGDTQIIIFYKKKQDGTNQYIYKISFLTVKCVLNQCKTVSQSLNYPQEQSSKIDSSFPFLMTLQEVPALIVSENSILKTIKYSNGAFFKQNFINDKYFIWNQSVLKSAQIGVNLQYHYYGDYDGDCISDLIFMVKSLLGQNLKSSFQFFQGLTGQNNLKFKPVSNIQYYHYVNHFTMGDINFDGRMDLLTLFQSTSNQAKVAIHYHKYGYSSSLCLGYYSEQSPALQKQLKLTVPYDFYPQTTSQMVQKFNSIVLIDGMRIDSQQSTIRLGDFDNNGYPDLSSALKNASDGSTKSFLFINQQCEGSLCGNINQNFVSKSRSLNIRYFRKRAFHTQLQNNKAKLIQSISFFDFFEDGILDLIINTLEVNSLTKDKRYQIITVFNNIRVDAFFMKFLLFDGRSKVIKQNGVLNGGNIQFYATLLSGQYTPLTENQLPQYSGRSLCLPYIKIGVGRTNNYAQDITVTYPYAINNQKSWTPVIPNSQIYIIPPKDQINKKWVMASFISPTQALGSVSWLIVVSLLVIGVAILYQTRKQKQMDKEDQDVYFSTLK